MESYINELGRLIGTPMRMTFVRLNSNTENSLVGKIVRIGKGKGPYDCGFLWFETVPVESERLQASQHLLNLSSDVITDISLLNEDYDACAYIRCPECKTIIQMEEIVASAE